MRCPECGYVQRPAPSCASCGARPGRRGSADSKRGELPLLVAAALAGALLSLPLFVGWALVSGEVLPGPARPAAAAPEPAPSGTELGGAAVVSAVERQDELMREIEAIEASIAAMEGDKLELEEEAEELHRELQQLVAELNRMLREEP